MSASFFDFIASVLLLEDPEGISEEDRKLRRQFVLKFQQVTGPVTAKGLEDTGFYRFYPLASLNEVGGDPATPGVTVEHFHSRMLEQVANWPHTMLATGTHDTKRGEDVRARIAVYEGDRVTPAGQRNGGVDAHGSAAGDQCLHVRVLPDQPTRVCAIPTSASIFGS